MQADKTRPLTKRENLLRLLFEHADEIIDRLDFLNESARKLDRFELLVNGFDGTPGLIETVEALTYEINRVERRIGRSSSVDITSLCIRINHFEAQLERLIVDAASWRKNQQESLKILRRLTAFSCVISLCVILNLSVLAWGFMGVT